MLEELNALFESDTIKPTFEQVHIILALFLFEQNPEGLGRYKLKEELLIGSGTARSLINKLREKINFLKIPDQSTRSGHVLTPKGERFVNKIKDIIPLLLEGDIELLNKVVIESKNQKAFFCLIKNVGNKITNGVSQRDASIKMDGSGATCLVFNGENFIFPSQSLSEGDKDTLKVSDDIQTYLIKCAETNDLVLETNDVIIIGLAINSKRARIATLNSALTLI